jgi:hypothetical protein
MKLLDLLRKLGILRFGAETGTYTNAADRSASLQMDGVFDSRKDLVTREDLPRGATGGRGRRS